MLLRQHTVLMLIRMLFPCHVCIDLCLNDVQFVNWKLDFFPTQMATPQEHDSKLSNDIQLCGVSLISPFSHHSPYADYAVPLYRNAHMAEKRAYHNATERARREVLNTRFQELAQSLPSLSNVRRPSKSVIVNHSLQFVKEIKRKVEIKDRALKSLRARNAQMVGEVNRLRVLLGMGGGPLQIETDEDLEEQEAAAAAALKTDSKNGSSERGSSSSETAKGDAGSASPDTRNLNADTDEDERQQVALAAEQGNMDQLDQRQSESPTGMTLQQGMNPAYNLDHILNEGTILAVP